MRIRCTRWTKAILFGWFFVLFLSIGASGQKRPSTNPPQPVTSGPAVTLIDHAGLKKLLVPNGKPLLINFWATWCDPCREEFPDLVKLDQEYKGKIDFVTVSLDDPADIATTVPRFLGMMKAEMPAYLLKTPDESAAIAMVSKDWGGGMPFTVLYSTKGELAYVCEGKVVLDTIRAELNRQIAAAK